MIFTKLLKKGMVSDWIFAILEIQQASDKFSFDSPGFHSIHIVVNL